MNSVKKIFIVKLSKFYLESFNIKPIISISYGIENVHLINVIRYGSTSVRLNITADEPVLSSNIKSGNVLSSYNYTALLTSSSIIENTSFDILIDLFRCTFSI